MRYVVLKLTVWLLKTTKRSRPKDLTSPQRVLHSTQYLVLFAWIGVWLKFARVFLTAFVHWRANWAFVGQSWRLTPSFAVLEHPPATQRCGIINLEGLLEEQNSRIYLTSYVIHERSQTFEPTAGWVLKLRNFRFWAMARTSNRTFRNFSPLTKNKEQLTAFICKYILFRL